MNVIDLSQLPAPNVVLPLDFEAVLRTLKGQVLATLPQLADVIDLESEPVNKVLQVIAYQHVNMQARINDAARACMLAYAQDNDLNHLSALLGVERLPDEKDSRLRYRAQMALEGETVAGSFASYKFHALSASAQVKDASVDSPQPGTVRVTVLSAENDGSSSPALLQQVNAALSAEDVRPLCDTVQVCPAQILSYEIHAKLHVYPGPAAQPLLQVAEQALQTYITAHQQLGHDITLSGIYACLHQPGVQRVELTAPAADIVVSPTQAAYCASAVISLGGVSV